MNPAAREKLCDIVRKYGRGVCDEPRRVQGLLADLCPDLKRETHALLGALEQGAVGELSNSSPTVPWPVTLGRLVRRLADETAMSEEAARWAVESWAAALGIVPAAAAAARPPEYDRTPPPARPAMPRLSEPPPLPPVMPRFTPDRAERGGPRQKPPSILAVVAGVAVFLVAVVAIGLRLIAWVSGPETVRVGSGPKDGGPEPTPVERLEAKGARVTPNDKGDIVQVDFPGAKLTDDDFRRICSFPELEELDLADASLSQEQAEGLAKLHKLRRLNLARARGPATLLDPLKKLERLTSLDLSGVKQIAFPDAAAGGFPELRHLHLEGAQLAEGGYDRIARLPKLEEIVLQGRGDAESFSFTPDQLRGLKAVAHPVEVVVDTVDEGPLKELESANENVFVTATILKTEVVIGGQKMAGPPLPLFLDAPLRPSDGSLVDSLDGEMIVVDPDPSAGQDRQRLRIAKENVTEFQVGRVNQRQSDKKLRVQASFVLDGKYGVTGCLDYRPGDKENTVHYLKFTPSFVFPPADLLASKDRRPVGGRKAAGVRRLPSPFVLTNTEGPSAEMYYVYTGSLMLQNVECTVTVGFDQGGRVELKRTYATWVPNEKKTIGFSATEGVPQTFRISGTAKIGEEDVLFDESFGK